MTSTDEAEDQDQNEDVRAVFRKRVALTRLPREGVPLALLRRQVPYIQNTGTPKFTPLILDHLFPESPDRSSRYWRTEE